MVKGRKPGEYEVKYRTVEGMPDYVRGVLDILSDISDDREEGDRLRASEVAEIVRADRRLIASSYPSFENDVERRSRAEDAWDSWYEKSVASGERPKRDYAKFVKALKDYELGRDVERSLENDNLFLMGMYMMASAPRSAKSMNRILNERLPAKDDVSTGLYLSRLQMYHGLVERLEDRSAANYRLTGKGKDFLYALKPALREVMEDGVGRMRQEKDNF